MHWVTKKYDLLYCDSCFILVVWNWIHSISEIHLYSLTLWHSPNCFLCSWYLKDSLVQYDIFCLHFLSLCLSNLLLCCLALHVFICLFLEISCQSNFLFSRSAEDVGPVLFIPLLYWFIEGWGRFGIRILPMFFKPGIPQEII